jgi:trehalose synthase
MHARLDRMPSAPASLEALEGIAPPAQLAQARELGATLGGQRVLYLSAAPGEPSDPSRSLVPLLAGLGLEAERAILHGDAEFAAAARELTGGLRGVRPAPSAGRWHAYREACEAAAVAFDVRSFDAVIVQGATAAPVIEGRLSDSAGWIWRSGEDHSGADPAAAELCDAALESYSTSTASEPAVDPLARGNRDPLPGDIGPPLRAIGIDLTRPLVCQAMVLDTWSDPQAAIESWRLARGELPGLQLALAGKIDSGDTEGAGVLAEIEAFSGGEADLHLLTDRTGAGEEELNAACRVARCLLHVSLSDDVDSTVAESLWRGTPAIGAGEGDAAQISDSTDGYLADTNEERAELLVELVGDPARAVAMGRAGREKVRCELLISRRLTADLELLGRPARSRRPVEPAGAGA